MSDLYERMQRQSREYKVKNAADGRKLVLGVGYRPPDVLPPSEWELVRLEMQSRLRAFTGETNAIVHFEFPADASL